MPNKTQTSFNHPLARSENLVVEAVGDETVVYDLDSHVAHALKPLAAAVFAYADGRSTAAEIAELASHRLATPVTQADVNEAVSQLDAIALLQAPVLDVHTGLSRRQALKTFAAAGAGSMLVMSVATSAASAYATGTAAPSPNCTCTKNGIGQAGAPSDGKSFKICSADSHCGSDQVCCCTPCDGADNHSCQPVCFWKSSNSWNGYCPTGTWPLAGKAGTIACPSGWAQYNQDGYQAKCCEVGHSSCPEQRNGVCWQQH